MMQFASFCIMPEHLVQTRVPTAVAKDIARRAEVDGESVAGWLRRLLIREHARTRVDAWARPANQADPRVFLYDPPNPEFSLELLTHLSGSETMYSVQNPRTQRPIPERACFEGWWFKEAAQHRWMLRGSPYKLLMVHGHWNSTAARLEIVLRACDSGQGD